MKEKHKDCKTNQCGNYSEEAAVTIAYDTWPPKKRYSYDSFATFIVKKIQISEGCRSQFKSSWVLLNIKERLVAWSFKGEST